MPFCSVSFADFEQENAYWDDFFWLWYNVHIIDNKLSDGFF